MPPRSLKTLSHAVAPDLFGVAPAWLEGLRYQPGLINAREDRELIAVFQSLPLTPFLFGAFEGKTPRRFFWLPL